MREAYLSFFEKNGHTRVETVPGKVARWRDDIYLTIASIADFQPFVTSGIVPPPAKSADDFPALHPGSMISIP